MKKILVTGGAGFIGHHFVEHILKNTDWNIVVLDRLDTSGNLNRLKDIEFYQKNKEEFNQRVKFIWHDLKAEINEILESQIGTDLDYIYHLAASSHVDRSLQNPLGFVYDNVVGTCNILNFARKCPNLRLFFNFNTDEVFGPAPVGVNHKETDQHKPSNPYSATKSGQYALGYAYWKSYGLPVVTTYTMNNFGERQNPEKLIPMTIRSVLKGEKAIIHGNEKVIGSRFWIHCRNTSAALLFLSENGKAGESYNIIGFDELNSLEMAQKIAEIMGKPLKYELVDFHKTRPGHDRRYALDGSKLKKLGFEFPVDFEASLKKTVEWSIKPEHVHWLGL